MMKNIFLRCPGSVDAVIYIKSGERKYGILIDQLMSDPYCFISTTDINLYLETSDPDYIEYVPGALIEAIDVDLK